MHLVIGNKNYSSWSLRAWLYMKASGFDFEETKLSLFTEEWSERIAEYSPAGRVPVLIDGEVTVWDTLAIVTYLRETKPQALDWPSHQPARSHAQAITAEMHSGFMAIRGELPQNLKTRRSSAPSDLTEDCRLQIHRVAQMWTDCLQRYGGPWLFGDFSIPDVFYAPVALRFVSYGIELPVPAESYKAAVTQHSYVQAWIHEAVQETDSLDFIDDRASVGDTPLVLG